MSIHRKLITVAAVAALGAGLAACGSSGGDGDSPTARMPMGMPMGTPVAFADLGAGQTVEAGTYAISDPSAEFLAAIVDFEPEADGYAPGAMESVGGLDFTCAADSATNCNVVVNEDGSVAITGTIEVAMTPPPPTPIESATMAAVTAASAAADDAQTAADDAQTAADAAKAAAANRATIQTVDSSYVSAHAAQMAADQAASDAADAKTSSDAAATADDVTMAIEHRVAAQTAQADAEDSRDTAEAMQAEAEARGAAEVQIVVKTKTVGETSITINDLTVDDALTGQTTGLQGGLKITDTGGGSPGSVQVDAALADVATPAVAFKAATPIVTARPIDIGVTYDSKDDDARLTLVTYYLDRQAASAFEDDASSGADHLTGTAANTVNQDGEAVIGTTTTPTPEIPVNAASGTFVSTGDADPTGMIDNLDTIATTTNPAQLYYYQAVHPADVGSEVGIAGAPIADDPATKYVDESKNYLRLFSSAQNPVTGVTTYTYRPVTVLPGIKIPMKAAYEHLHYGLWNALTPATKTSADKIADLGIGFVTATPTGTGMTEEMPQHGDATYAGNWVANIQGSKVAGGQITRAWNGATVDANFVSGDVEIGLSTLADLEGTIADNTFSGTKATAVAAPVGGLGTGTFTGEFNGGFFGAGASEVGGVFDFGSAKSNAQGAFVGSFGGVAQPDTTAD